MPKRKSTARANVKTGGALPETVEEEVTSPTTQTPQEPPKDAPVYAADPHPKLTISLSDERGGPKAQLLRSHKFNQMQVRFDGEQPGDETLAMLKQSGWRDRREEEGIFTKQIDRDARWQSVDQMEKEFKSIANRIRESKGLEPALAGPVPA